MVNRVVSTKMTEEEHGKIVELCNDIGISVSAMVKQAIRDRMKKEEKEKKKLESQMKKINQKTNTDVLQKNINSKQVSNWSTDVRQILENPKPVFQRSTNIKNSSSPKTIFQSPQKRVMSDEERYLYF